jgi:uncharacterized protein YbjT (DUF2867 family)
MLTKDVYVVTGATGNIGRKLVEHLAAAKLKVRAIARNADNLRSLGGRGVQIFPGSLDDAGSMTHAFTGAKVVFTMIPPNYKTENFRSYQNTISQVLAASITGAGVDYVVNLSSVGAQHREKVGPINGLFDHEQRMNNLNGVNVLHLRPAYFMENHFGSAEMIRKAGIYGSPIKPDIAFPMIATADIALEAAARMKLMDFKGKTVKELLGPRDYTMSEVTTHIGRILERPDAKYQQFAYEDAEKAMTGMGLSRDLSSLYVQMMRAINEGIMKPTEPRSAKNTTKTAFEDFVKVFATLPRPVEKTKRSPAGSKRR